MVFESGDQRAWAQRARSVSNVNGEENGGIAETVDGVCSTAGATAVAAGSFTISAIGAGSILQHCDVARCSSAFFNPSSFRLISSFLWRALGLSGAIGQPDSP